MNSHQPQQPAALRDLDDAHAPSAIMSPESANLGKEASSQNSSTTNPSVVVATPPEGTSILSSLPPPDPYALRVRNLSIQAPPAAVQIPFTVPISLPHGVAKKLGLAKGEADDHARLLLNKISFECLPGELLAIIGGSGSGKTTALNAAALRLANLRKISGDVSLLPAGTNHRASINLSSRNIGSVMGYVRQDDFLMPYLSVKETLEFSAALRLPASLDKATKAAIVMQTMAELGLADVADVIVGGPGYRKGISRGERRRLSIGCILVTLPSVLLLDEPTTGLDATTSFHLLQLLSKLAKRNRTIILTIHQPRSDAFPLFDRLCLLSSGSVAYSGPRSDVLPYFAKLGYETPLHTNPLDFLLNISSVDRRSDEAEIITGKGVEALLDAWKSRSDAEMVDEKDVKMSKGEKRQSRAASLKAAWSSAALNNNNKEGIQRAGLFQQCLLLSQRASKNLLRDHSLLFGFFLQAVIIGLATGVTFYLGDGGPKNPSEIQTFKTVIFQSHSAYFYLFIVLYIYLSCQGLVIFDRERDDGLYGAIPYVVSTVFSYLPVNIVGPTIYAVIIYFLCGFRRDNLARNLFIWLGDYWMQAQAVLGYALLMASFIRNFAEASTLGNALSIIFVVCAGYLIVTLPGYMAWTRFFAPYYYGFHWTAIEQLQGRTFACEGVSGAASNQCSGEQVLAGLRFEGHPTRVYPLGLLGFILVVFFLATLTLHFHKPGGVRFAQQQLAARPKELKQEDAAEKLIAQTRLARNPVMLQLRSVKLKVSPRRYGILKAKGSAEKVILEGITAEFGSGKVTAILGPSGSGKTSLLQLLAGRLTKASLFRSEGAILFKGQPASNSTRSLVGFVEQHDDHHLPALTVRETLHYAASLRLRNMSKSAKRERAEDILRSLGLKSCADNLVGGALVKGISGGEKRRLSLAVELLSDPSVLLVDEPTSGLDAYNAKSVMEVLRDIADSGRTVIVSIHQPSSEIWSSFDDVLLLAKGGRTVAYARREDALPVFAAAGYECPAFYNPADFLLDTIAIDARSAQAKETTSDRLNNIIANIKAADQAKQLEEGSAAASDNSTDHRADTKTSSVGDYPSQAFRVAFPVVLQRAFKNLRRQKDVFVVRLFNPPFLALLFWLFFLRLSKGPSGAQNRVGLLQENSALPFVGMLTSVAIFPKERDAFYHERISAARYSTFTFLLSYTVQELPMQIIAALLYSVIMVYGMALQGSPRIFFEFAVCIWGALNFGESVGIIFSSWIRSGGLSISVVSVALTIQAQLSGIMSVSIPYWLQVIAWCAPLKYLSRIQIINEMRGLSFNCDAASIQSGICIAETGDQLLDTFGIDDRDTSKFLGIFIAVIFIYRALAYLALSLRVSLL